MASWKTDTDPTGWIRNSVVWYSRRSPRRSERGASPLPSRVSTLRQSRRFRRPRRERRPDPILDRLVAEDLAAPSRSRSCGGSSCRLPIASRHGDDDPASSTPPASRRGNNASTAKTGSAAARVTRRLARPGKADRLKVRRLGRRTADGSSSRAWCVSTANPPSFRARGERIGDRRSLQRGRASL